MEKRTKPDRRKKSDSNDEAKPFNKGFYGKKVESGVGVNKEKTTKKWQPNEDLINDTAFSLAAKASNKAVAPKKSTYSDSDSKTTGRKPWEKTDSRETARPKRAGADSKFESSEKPSRFKKKSDDGEETSSFFKSDAKSAGRKPWEKTDSRETARPKRAGSDSKFDSSEKPSRFKRKSEDAEETTRYSSSDTKSAGRKPWEKTDSRETARPKRAGSDSKFDSSEKPSRFKRSSDDESSKYTETNSRRTESSDDSRPEKRRSIYDKDESSKGLPYKKSYKPYKKGNPENSIKAKTLKKDPLDDSIRLNKFISNAGICSRREADDLIKAGAVTVNGKVITEMGFKIKRTDLVNYGGQGLKPEKLVYILLNKPKDYITTSDDPQERRTVLELIKGAGKERLYPVGRLDRNTTGLLLMTNDGDLTDKITHPSFKQKKIYHVELDKPLKKEHLKAIQDGLELEDGIIKVDEISYVDEVENKKEVGITLHSGRNRIVRRIFEHFEYKVKKLDRVYFAGLTKKDLGRGRWRHLTAMELNMLKMVQ